MFSPAKELLLVKQRSFGEEILNNLEMSIAGGNMKGSMSVSIRFVLNPRSFPTFQEFPDGVDSPVS